MEEKKNRRGGWMGGGALTPHKANLEGGQSSESGGLEAAWGPTPL